MTDQLPGDTDARRLRRSFRVGILLARTQEYVPFVSVGLAKDGGLFVSPVDVNGDSWTQGPIVPGRVVTEQPELATSDKRPRLHYHRSGIVRASPSGTRLSAATSEFEPLPERGVGTLVSVVVCKPDLLLRREFRTGDISTLHGMWPETATISFSIIAPGQRDSLLGDDDFAA